MQEKSNINLYVVSEISNVMLPISPFICVFPRLPPYTSLPTYPSLSVSFNVSPLRGSLNVSLPTCLLRRIPSYVSLQTYPSLRVSLDVCEKQLILAHVFLPAWLYERISDLCTTI